MIISQQFYITNKFPDQENLIFSYNINYTTTKILICQEKNAAILCEKFRIDVFLFIVPVGEDICSEWL